MLHNGNSRPVRFFSGEALLVLSVHYGNVSATEKIRTLSKPSQILPQVLFMELQKNIYVIFDRS